jgi:hypothetical protein
VTFEVNMMAHPDRRKTGAILAIVILVGLASRTLPIDFPRLIGKHLGDVLWSLMFVLIVLLLRPGTRAAVAAVIGFAISAGTEFLKLAHAPWLDDLRTYRVPAFVLGTEFHLPNLLTYPVGALIGMALRRTVLR